MAFSIKKYVGRIAEAYNQLPSVKRINHLRRMVNALAIAARPFTQGTGTTRQEVVPRYPWSIETVYLVSYYSDILTTIQISLRREMFRNGYDLVKAKNLSEEHTLSEQEGISVGDDEKTKKEILEFLENCNANQQRLQEVLVEFEDHLNIIDDAYLLFLFDYEHDSQGKLASRKLRELITADSKFMALIMNDRDVPGHDEDDNTIKFCPEHRYDVHINKSICPQCGREMMLAAYKTIGGIRETYYSQDEVIHKSRYRPSRRLGFSPVITLWQKTRTLYMQDQYILEMYEGKRPPKGMLIFNTPNRASLKAAWTEMIDRTRANPHLPAVLGLENKIGNQGGKSVAEFIDFMKPLDELQFTEQRNEFRQAIGSVYGVMPIFQGDLSTGGGLNNEGLQITVTNRAVEDGQKMYNTGVLPAIIKAMGYEGWSLTLNPSEEKDEEAQLERESKTLQNGELALRLGLQAEYDDDQGMVIIKPGPLEDTQAGFGGFGESSDSLPPPQEAAGTPPEPQNDITASQKSAKYIKRWKDDQGKWQYEYDHPAGAKPKKKDILNKPVEEWTDEERDYAENLMQQDEVKYDSKDLEQAKRFLKDHPQLRQKYGKQYYNFAVQVANAIHEGISPDLIDWESMDSTLSPEEAIRDFRLNKTDIKKALSPARRNFSQLEKLLKKQIEKFIKTYKRKPSEKELLKAIKKMDAELQQELLGATHGAFRKTYNAEVEKVGQELGVNIAFSQADQRALTTLMQQPVLYKAFAGLTNTLTAKVHDIIKEAYKNPTKELTVEKISDRIKDITNLADYRAENIARTETNKVSMAARRMSYKKEDPQDEFVYKWIGPDDYRTTPTSKRIVQRVGKGVGWDELVQIVKEESIKDFPTWHVNKDFPVSHWQSRHTFVRVV